MAWSTAEIARLAGTTVKAVRHYHRVGLLDEPLRMSNGYKRYETAHLVRLIQIRRLIDVGVSLSGIAELDLAGERQEDVIRALDADLEARIASMTAIRAELAALLESGGRLESPSALAGIHARTPARELSFAAVYSRVAGKDAVRDLGEAMASRDAIDDDLEALPASASDEEIEALARRLAPVIRLHQQRFPALIDPIGTAPHVTEAQETLAFAFQDLFNAAQIRALIRANELVNPAEPSPA